MTGKPPTTGIITVGVIASESKAIPFIAELKKRIESISYGLATIEGHVLPGSTPNVAVENVLSAYLSQHPEASGLMQYVFDGMPSGATMMGWGSTNGNPGFSMSFDISQFYYPGHEFTHAMGSPHLHGMASPGGAPLVLNAECVVIDKYESMDMSDFYPAPLMHQFEWLFPVDAIDGEYEIFPIEQPNGLRAIRFRIVDPFRPLSESYCYISYRQPIGADTDLQVGRMNGVTLALADKVLRGTDWGEVCYDSWTLCIHDSLNPALRVGESFLFDNGKRVEVLSATSTSAKVRISSGNTPPPPPPPPPVNTPPTVSILTPSNGAVFAEGSMVNIQISASDVESSIKEAAIYVDGILIAKEFQATWRMPSQHGKKQHSHTITGKATDMAGLVGAKSVTIYGK